MFIRKSKLKELESRITGLENSIENRKDIPDKTFFPNMTAEILDEWLNGEQKSERDGKWQK